MRVWSKRIPFKVDIAGVIEIMGSSLYSRPDTPIRELIQNAHDAIMRRRNRDLDYQGRIDIEQDAQRNTLRRAKKSSRSRCGRPNRRGSAACSERSPFSTNRKLL